MIIEPLDLSGFSEKHFVVELYSRAQLTGKRQKLVQYEDFIKQGIFRIFHIECNAVSTTLIMSERGALFGHFDRFSKPINKRRLVLAQYKKHSEIAKQLSEFLLKRHTSFNEYMQSLIDYFSSISEDENDDSIIGFMNSVTNGKLQER
jgi:hypothetical protein